MKHIWLLLLCIPMVTIAQKVTVSKEVNVRNDLGYEILGKISDHILLFRDNGDEYSIEVFDANLTHKLKRDIPIERRRIDMLGTVSDDDSFSIVYTYKAKEGDILRHRRLDYKGDLIDTLTLDTIPRVYGRDAMRMVVSPDKSKLLLFSREKRNQLHLTIYDNEVDSLPILWRKTVFFTDYDLRRDFRSIIITDHASVCVVVESKRDNEDEHHVAIAYIEEDLDSYTPIYYDGVMSSDLDVRYDNINRQIVLVGLYNDGNSNDTKGYYYYKSRIADLGTGPYSFVQVPWGLEFMAEVYGKRIGRVKELSYFDISNLLLRRDGGFVFMAEMNRMYSRRSAFGGTGFGNDVYGRGWTDYYNEDIVAVAVHPDGTEHWRTIFYKKQFSQDDEGMYSSYCLMETPSRLKILYNDEIKKDNTVSAYVMDPLGRYDRNSVLSTEYQKLKLRFKDAVQISSTELVVPSERSLSLSLVKIDWGS